ncbi:MAG: histidine phosphatase family protein [bacterium]
MSLTVYFLRHGETESSRVGGFCGVSDPALTSEGHRMAEQFAAAYQSFPWAAVYCSPLRRSKDTAKPLCDAAGLDMQVRDGLREINFGKWEGKTPGDVKVEYHDEYVRWMADPGWNRPTGGERGVDVARRSSMVLDEIERDHLEGKVLVVSHKATTRIMICLLLGIDVGRYRDRIDMPVASLNVVEMTEQGPLLKLLGDRSHLNKDLRERQGT